MGINLGAGMGLGCIAAAVWGDSTNTTGSTFTAYDDSCGSGTSLNQGFGMGSGCVSAAGEGNSTNETGATTTADSSCGRAGSTNLGNSVGAGCVAVALTGSATNSGSAGSCGNADGLGWGFSSAVGCFAVSGYSASNRVSGSECPTGYEIGSGNVSATARFYCVSLTLPPAIPLPLSTTHTVAVRGFGPTTAIKPFQAQYDPPLIIARPGDTIVFQNFDDGADIGLPGQVPHTFTGGTVLGDGINGTPILVPWDQWCENVSEPYLGCNSGPVYGTPSGGDAVTFTVLDKPGIHFFHCYFHPNRNGIAIVL